MKKVIKLTENDIKQMVKDAINEISYKKAYDAQYYEGDKFRGLRDEFESFYRLLLYNYGNVVYPSKGTYYYEPNLNYENKYIAEIMKHAAVINDILEKKVNQAEKIDNRLQDFDWGEYYDSEEGQEEDYDDKDLNYLINKYPSKKR